MSECYCPFCSALKVENEELRQANLTANAIIGANCEELQRIIKAKDAEILRLAAQLAANSSGSLP